MDKMINNLHILMDRKIEAFGQLLDMTMAQKADIEKNDASNIETLVNEKQKIIDKVDEIDRIFDGQFNLLKKNLGVSSLENIDTKRYPSIVQLRDKVQRVFELARNIMEIEKENNEKLTIIFNNVKNELRRVSIGKKSLKAYEPAAPTNDGIYIDKKVK